MKIFDESSLHQFIRPGIYKRARLLFAPKKRIKIRTKKGLVNATLRFEGDRVYIIYKGQ